MNSQKAKSLLIEARKHCARKDFKWTILSMKWAMEAILPEGHRYCTSTLPDDDQEKTLQGFLDNIVDELRPRRS